MDQRELHALEARCVHDAPPPCAADCPLGVDARGVLEAVAEGRFGDGLRLLTARVLLPELLCRVCEEPCRGACPREGTGGSLQVRALEAACVAYGAEAAARRVPPRKGTAAVVGGGLAGMTAALDLALRGYRVRLLEAAERARRRACAATRASRRRRSGIRRRAPRARRRPRRGGTGGRRRRSGGAGRRGRRRVRLACAGLTASGGRRGRRVTPARTARSSRRPPPAAAAAAAADLVLRGVPDRRPAPPGRRGRRCRTASAPSAPPLAAVVAARPGARHDARRRRRARPRRCLRCACRECLDACLFLERSAASPKALLREINNNLVVSPGMGYRASKAIINACRLCGLCAEVCPADIDFGGGLPRGAPRPARARRDAAGGARGAAARRRGEQRARLRAGEAPAGP